MSCLFFAFMKMSIDCCEIIRLDNIKIQIRKIKNPFLGSKAPVVNGSHAGMTLTPCYLQKFRILIEIIKLKHGQYHQQYQTPIDYQLAYKALKAYSGVSSASTSKFPVATSKHHASSRQSGFIGCEGKGGLIGYGSRSHLG